MIRDDTIYSTVEITVEGFGLKANEMNRECNDNCAPTKPCFLRVIINNMLDWKIWLGAFMASFVDSVILVLCSRLSQSLS